MVNVFGVLNVTPDSFSDGGRYVDVDAAVRRGHELSSAGAWAVDVGGESTRPGAEAVPTDVELHRVLPVVERLTRAGLRVSIDTMHASVAAAALNAGATIVNDVSGGRFDPAILDVAADYDATLILSHWRAPSREMDRHAVYSDVVAEVVAELSQSVDAALDAGVGNAQLIVDPGIGFAKTGPHNWRLLQSLPVLRSALGLPIMVGTSRKRFLGDVVADARSPRARDDLTAVTSALATTAGADYVRVHDVASTSRAIAVAVAWIGGMHGSPSGVLE